MNFIQVYKANKAKTVHVYRVYLIEFISDFSHQQHPPFFFSNDFPLFLVNLAPSVCLGFGADVATLPFISLVIVVNASSTLSDSFAEVSKNLTLK